MTNNLYICAIFVVIEHAVSMVHSRQGLQQLKNWHSPAKHRAGSGIISILSVLFDTSMRSFSPENTSPRDLHAVLLNGVAPRPIALVSSMSADERVNLSPFSFFNAFSSNPPVVVFSPSYRGTDGTAKDSFLNVVETGECTISAVPYRLVEQVSLASAQYAHGVDEFEKAGLTKRPSVEVAPPGVAESPFIMECKLMQHIELAKGAPASGNLMICRVLRIHVAESAFNGDKLDPHRLDLVARMGYSYYCRASGNAVFEAPQPRAIGIGFDALPGYIRTSDLLTGNDLALLAGVPALPERDPAFPAFPDGIQGDSVDIELAAGNPTAALSALMLSASSKAEKNTALFRIAKGFLQQRKVAEAWQTLYMVQ